MDLKRTRQLDRQASRWTMIETEHCLRHQKRIHLPVNRRKIDREKSRSRMSWSKKQSCSSNRITSRSPKLNCNLMKKQKRRLKSTLLDYLCKEKCPIQWLRKSMLELVVVIQPEASKEIQRVIMLLLSSGKKKAKTFQSLTWIRQAVVQLTWEIHGKTYRRRIHLKLQKVWSKMRLHRAQAELALVKWLKDSLEKLQLRIGSCQSRTMTIFPKRFFSDWLVTMLSARGACLKCLTNSLTMVQEGTR